MNVDDVAEAICKRICGNRRTSCHMVCKNRFYEARGFEKHRAAARDAIEIVQRQVAEDQARLARHSFDAPGGAEVVKCPK